MYPRRAFGPSKENLKAVSEFASPQTYTKIWAFLGLVSHYQQFIKGICPCVSQPLHEHLSSEGASNKNEQVMLTQCMHSLPLRCFREHLLKAPVLDFANFDKPFLLETDVSQVRIGVVLSQKQPDGQYHPVAYASQSLTIHEHNYYSTNQEFLALKWVNCWAVPGIPALETICCENWK